MSFCVYLFHSSRAGDYLLESSNGSPSKVAIEFVAFDDQYQSIKQEIETPSTDSDDVEPPVKVRKATKPQSPSESSTAVEIIKYFDSQRKTEKTFDATDSLFLALSKTLKTFSERRQTLTKIKISRFIMEQELLHQNEVNGVVTEVTDKIQTQS